MSLLPHPLHAQRGDFKLAQIATLLRLARSLSAAHGDAPLVLAGDFNLAPFSALYNFLLTGALRLDACHRSFMAGHIAPPHGGNGCQGGGRSRRDRVVEDPLGAWDPEPLRAVFSASQVTLGMPGAPGLGPGPAPRSAHGPAGDLELPRRGLADHGVFVEDAVGAGWEPVAQHFLPLRSVQAALLGAEPNFTSSHANFVGTCDYIFVSEGVEAVSVLAPPAVATPLPSAQCPSDHVFLLFDLRLRAPAGAPPRERLHEAASAALLVPVVAGAQVGGALGPPLRASGGGVRVAEWWAQWAAL